MMDQIKRNKMKKNLIIPSLKMNKSKTQSKIYPNPNNNKLNKRNP